MIQINQQIKNCLKTISSLYTYLKILGGGVLAIVAMYSFLGEAFSVLMAKSILAVAGTMILFICFTIFKKLAIIEKLNLKKES